MLPARSHTSTPMIATSMCFPVISERIDTTTAARRGGSDRDRDRDRRFTALAPFVFPLCAPYSFRFRVTIHSAYGMIPESVERIVCHHGGGGRVQLPHHCSSLCFIVGGAVRPQRFRRLQHQPDHAAGVAALAVADLAADCTPSSEEPRLFVLLGLSVIYRFQIIPRVVTLWIAPPPTGGGAISRDYSWVHLDSLDDR